MKNKNTSKAIVKFISALLLVLYWGCSSGDDSVENPEPEPVPELQEPIAVEDSFSLTENQEIVLEGFIDNDDVAEGARITSVVDVSAAGGTIVDNRNGSYTYTPKSNYVGEDTFTYELCLIADTSICSTGTVNLTIEDAGDPVANDDEVSVAKNKSIILSNLLGNDELIDGAVLTSVTAGAGLVELDDNGLVTYTPPSNFIGEDRFTYAICDNDAVPTCSTATVTVNIVEAIAFNIPSELVDYYSDASFFQDGGLTSSSLTALTVSKHTTILTYFERHEYLYDADADLDNQANVILMYSGESRDRREYTSGSNSHTPQTFNTEHIFPQSRLSTEEAVTDLHHLRSTDDEVNSLRLNYPYTDGSGAYQLVNGNSWFPGDEWKGDVARMVLYLNVRYGEDYTKVGTLDLFLKWNREDPVSDFERQRNEVIEGAQGVRNPFIDNPYLATLIWGGTPAENTWE
ncbi:endonuclease [Leeuwenhoekiella palythoae]|uniref:Endonuclease I n=1 Tax=Leeuwenhoekiella palythoae TaxID=573501 RepID=A0A1M5W9E6_9FLAO|nr:endonuclease [Leeuwenhoekiella palythoae]RXG31261.1 endonuclease I [Leeuwenhoekiella palythoae]SHH84142.1 Endonuclease I [Leeuwenhoekiella palythoae]